MKRSSLFLALSLGLTLSACAGAKQDVEPKSYMQVKSDESSVAGYEAYSNGDYRKAFEKFRESLRINRSIDNRAGELLDLINIGRTSVALGDHKTAIRHLNEAVSLGALLNDEKGLSEAYATLAKADHLSGDSASALDHIEESLIIDERHGIKSGAKLNLKGLIYAESGRKNEAVSVLKTALELNRGRKDALEVANSYRALAELYRISKSPEDAYSYYEKAYEADRLSGASERIALDLEKMAGLKAEQGKVEEAVFLFERAYIVSLNSGRMSEALLRVDKLIQAYRDLGNEEKAVYYIHMREGLLGNKVERVKAE